MNPAEDNFLGELADRAGLNSTMKRLAASGMMRREYKNGGISYGPSGKAEGNRRRPEGLQFLAGT